MKQCGTLRGNYPAALLLFCSPASQRRGQRKSTHQGGLSEGISVDGGGGGGRRGGGWLLSKFPVPGSVNED
ncbi:unnamed protein product [Pleuronectes platessa]|uniref:Uncharacterized protein n=1 Tax=Pleuronectes platessa TaxID=8262 RepID=A0A9N7YVF6_PLEPL|nr:unnamed protein product [Pleuronectes platessa]